MKGIGFKITCLKCGKEYIFNGSYKEDKENEAIQVYSDYMEMVNIECECGNEVDEI